MSSDRRICWAVKAAFLSAALALPACVTVSNAGQTLSGKWGGDQVELSFAEDGSGHVTLPCAGAQFDGPVRTDVGGHWLKSGTYTQGSGAPPPTPPVPVPANISGRLDRDGTLWLSIATSDGMKVDNRKLRQGQPANLQYCP